MVSKALGQRNAARDAGHPARLRHQTRQDYQTGNRSARAAPSDGITGVLGPGCWPPGSVVPGTATIEPSCLKGHVGATPALAWSAFLLTAPAAPPAPATRRPPGTAPAPGAG